MARRLCTKDNPCTDERDLSEPGYGWEHEDAYEVGEQVTGWPGGDIVRMKCPNCGTSWTTELPQ
jgi:hypothetical protein